MKPLTVDDELGIVDVAAILAVTDVACRSLIGRGTLVPAKRIPNGRRHMVVFRRGDVLDFARQRIETAETELRKIRAAYEAASPPGTEAAA